MTEPYPLNQIPGKPRTPTYNIRESDEIKQAYKKLSLTHHPDVGGDREKWERLSKAYQEALKLVSV